MVVDLRRKTVRPTNMTLVCICGGPYCPICSHELSKETVGDHHDETETMKREDQPNA